MLAPLSYDPDLGIAKYYDRPEGELRPRVRFDVSDPQPSIDLCTHLRGISDYQSTHKKRWAHAAHTPQAVCLELYHRYGVNIYNKDQHMRALALIERDPDFSKLRLGPKKFSRERGSVLYAFAPKERFERHDGCELTKIMDACH